MQPFRNREYIINQLSMTAIIPLDSELLLPDIAKKELQNELNTAYGNKVYSEIPFYYRIVCPAIILFIRDE